jgi:uncharacterized protein YcbK (DUF882 family)
LGCTLGLAIALIIFGTRGLETAIANGDTRTISLHHVHTDESLTITYKKDGRYDPEALKKLNWLLRDWRKGQAIRMEPHLIDLVWEVSREAGAKGPIQIICGYRSPSTNGMLRARTNGVAQHSQHMLGRAMDFFIPGVPLEKLRAIGMRLQRGGVGYYPHSGSPFVHMDVARVRAWPRMSRPELARLFPDGRTVHIPADGRPLAGYAQALADLRKRDSGGATVLASADSAGSEMAYAKPESENTLGLNALFAIASHPAQSAATHQATAAAKPLAVAQTTVPVETVRLPRNRPTFQSAALPAQAIPTTGQPIQVASAGDDALNAFAAPRLPKARPHNLGGKSSGNLTQVAYGYAGAPSALTSHGSSLGGTTIAVKQPEGMHKPAAATAPASANAMGVASYSDPWLTAAIVTPSIATYMTTLHSGPRDMVGLVAFMQKPRSSVASSFTHDPRKIMPTQYFSGNAVSFVATTAFREDTASLAFDR